MRQITPETKFNSARLWSFDISKAARGAGGLTLVAVLTACGPGTSAPTPSESVPGSTAPTAGTSAPQTPTKDPRGASLPPRQEPRPPILTEAQCYKGFWQDKDGKRQPPVSVKPLVVLVEGRCNTPLDDPNVGIYYTPEQVGNSPIDAVNGDALLVVGYVRGQSRQDIRGPSSASDVWLNVVTRQGEVGLVPEVNVGYVDEQKIG